MALFHGDTEIEGNVYVSTQVVTFPDEMDISTLPCGVVSFAAVFIDHVPRILE